MKICISAVSGGLDSPLDPRFGRCQYFVIVDFENLEIEAISNVASGAMSGAGVQAAQTAANKGVKIVITGNVGPKAFAALQAGGVRIHMGATGSVGHAIEQFRAGKLECVSKANVEGHWL